MCPKVLKKQCFSASCSVPHELFLAAFLLARKSIMLAFTAYFTFIGSWITKPSAHSCSFFFFSQPSSIILQFCGICVTLLGFFSSFQYIALLKSQLHDAQTVLNIKVVRLKALFNFQVYKLHHLI